MTRSKLLLTPNDPQVVPADAESLVRELGILGFAGTPFLLLGRTHYLPGDRFLELVTFLGCSPVVALGPPLDAPADPAAHADAFCHVGIRYAGEHPEFISGRNTAPPRCRECRHREPDWQKMIEAWRSSPEVYRWLCPTCGHHASPFELDWRQSAGFGRFFLEIWGIHPAEAVPGPALLETLRHAAGEPWGHFYWQGDERPSMLP